MQRRDFIKQSSAALAFSASRPSISLAEPHRPVNLLFITVDDMNHTLPGFMGGKYDLTPSLDALALRSHRFINSRTTAPICQPSREAMMTGRVPHRSGGLGFNPIREGVQTLTTILKSHNYYTAAIHKTEHMQPPSCFPWDQAVVGMGRNPAEYASAVREAMDQARALNRPFFVNCNINDPHRPFYGSPGATEVDHHETESYKVARELQAEDVEVPSFLENLPDIRKEFAQYCNSAQRMDVSIGKVLDILRASPEADNTIVLFTADHGMPFPFSKATAYTNGTRTPVLLSWPRMGTPRVFEDLTCNIDLLPTLLDLMNIPTPDGVDGRSWLPIVNGHSQHDREYVITYVNTLSSAASYPMRAIQNKRYSLIFSPWSDGKLQYQAESMIGLTYKAMARAAETDSRIAARVRQYIIGIPLAFYDLEADPDQRLNLIDVGNHRKEIDRMKEALLRSMEKSSDPQLENFKAYLAGGKPVVIQPSK